MRVTMNNRYLLTTYASHHIPEVFDYKKQAEDLGWDFKVGGGDNNWLGFKQKLLWVKNNIDEWKKSYDYILFTDAWDVKIFGTPTDLDVILKKYSYPKAVASCECACWPKQENASKHKPYHKDYPWKYIHALYVLRTDSIDLFSEPITDYTDDQQYIQEMFLANPELPIDYECEIFQQLAHLHPYDKYFEMVNGRVYNKLTETYPITVHANGRTDWNWIK